MYYISDLNHTKEAILYGVTDTKDGVKEFYTKEQIYKMVKSIGLKIEGATLTGSGIKLTRKYPNEALLENLEKGACIIYEYEPVMYVGLNGKSDFVFFDLNGEFITVKKSVLQKAPNKIDTSKTVDNGTVEYFHNFFKETNPTHQLSQWL